MAIIENEDCVIVIKKCEDLKNIFNLLSREIYRMADENIIKEDIIIKIDLD